MSPLGLGAVLLASLLGSVHCVAMCGGFATAVIGGRPRAGDRRAWRRRSVAYQGGRLVGYLALGLAAGLLGTGLDRAGESLAGLQRIAALLTGVTLIALALVAMAPRRAPSPAPLVTAGLRPRAPTLGQRWLVGWLRRGGLAGATAVGLGSALLPCGWLWGYVLVAASTGAVTGALAVMFVFWLGALPALLSVGALAGWLHRRLGPHAPRLVAAVMLLLGAMAIVGRPRPAPTTAPGVDIEAATPPPCHAP